VLGSDFDTEQMELIDKVDKAKQQFRGQGFSWNRLRGDATVRILEFFIQVHIPKQFNLVRYAWVEGSEEEFDLLVTDAGAVPLPFTNVYHKDDVHLIIEAKSSGLFWRKSEVEVRLRDWKKKVQEKTGKIVLYLTFWERRSYYEKVLAAIGDNDAFTFKVDDEVKPGEWMRFISRVRSLLPSPYQTENGTRSRHCHISPETRSTNVLSIRWVRGTDYAQVLCVLW
jgi:hypothetical protein